MLILGIDPGFATIGFGAVSSDRNTQTMFRYGAIRTPAGLPFPSRLSLIAEDMEDLIQAIKPDEIAVEELFFNTNLTTGIQVAHARGVILLAAERGGIPIFEYTPLQIKLAVSGYGRASKNQVMQMTRSLLKMSAPAKPDDAADALAVALCHARSATSLLRSKSRA